MDSLCENKKRTSKGVYVQLPDGTSIESTHTALINFPNLPIEARRAHLFPKIKHALLSISMLCDHGFTVIFDKDGVYIVKEGRIIMHGFRHPITKLYIVNMKKDTNPPKLDIIKMINLKAILSQKKLIEYYHKCCFSPEISTWIKAIKKGFFCTWP